jgi:hypothetical protein
LRVKEVLGLVEELDCEVLLLFSVDKKVLNIDDQCGGVLEDGFCDIKVEWDVVSDSRYFDVQLANVES